jgi:hypothetical protein
VITSSDDSIYIAGLTNSSALDGVTLTNETDGFVTRYNSDGTKIWTRLETINSTDSFGTAVNTGVATTTDGAIYLVGYTYCARLDGQRSNGGMDGFISRYSSDGSKVWTKLIGDTGNDRVSSVTSGPDGAIYVVGNIGGTNNHDGYEFVTRYNSDGSTDLTLKTNQDSSVNSLTIGANGAIYLTGCTATYAGGFIVSSFITCYKSDGTVAWTQVLGGTGVVQIHSVTASAEGAIYVAGATSNSSLDGQASHGTWDGFLTRYNSDGSKAWTVLVGGTGEDHITSVTTGTDGTIYVAGTTGSYLDGQSVSGAFDGFVSCYTSNGIRLWTQLIGGTDGDQAYSVTAGVDGIVYVAGSTGSPTLNGYKINGPDDAFLLKIASPSYVPPDTTAPPSPPSAPQTRPRRWPSVPTSCSPSARWCS